jgi:UDP-2,3-diacylglucosamine pyrophosphatase LpxH
VRSLIISDLHLGGRSGVDLLRLPAVRAALLEELDGVDRLVLLGDVLELRHGPRRDAMAAARPFFEALGDAFAGREVIVLAGNHDHALIEPWLQQRSSALSAPAPLVAEQRFSAAEGSPMLAAIAEWASPATVSAAYPGVWVRPDVYATHGHYLDCHMRIPTMERLGIGAVGRLQRRPAASLDGPDDYEALLSPVYAWIDAMAQQVRTHAGLDPATVRAWRALGGDRDHKPNSRRAALRNRLFAGGFPLAVAALNRAGFGPLQADISGPDLRRAGLAAMGEAITRLGAGEQSSHVVFGHTHRTGPLPHDERLEWRTPGGAQLLNCGCWTYDAYFLRGQPSSSPYWPGGSVLVEEEGPPVLGRLLAAREHAELMPSPA